MSESRVMTDVDAIAEQYLDATVAHDPLTATAIGIGGHDHELPRLDPDWYAERSRIRRDALHRLAGAVPADDTDRVTVAALREALEAAEALRDLGVEESEVNNIACPVQGLRDVFDLTSTDTADDWAVVARRLGALPDSVEGYIASLRQAAGTGDVRPRRQIEAAAAQCAANTGAAGFFAAFARDAVTSDGTALPDTLHGDLTRASEGAAAAYGRLERYLRDELLPLAGDRDAIGRERYVPHSRYFLGTTVDLDEAYEWGQAEVDRIAVAMRETAERVRPGSDVAGAIAFLDSDPARQLDGTAALQAWMQQTSDAAMDALADTHFDIPAPIRRLECRIAPTSDGGIYYSAPSDDLVTRPGRMWWSVPPGQTRFSTWQERTTVYHEGVPGHHLQIAQTVFRRELLNRWRRLDAWTSGYGEGWALYAEQLMADLGFLDDPGDYLGMLDGQSLRAARVVIDIGMHCELSAPAEVGGGAWDYDKAWRYLTAHSSAQHDVLRFELDRYLGWPGQAPSYKLGQRLWLQLRDEVRDRNGAAFDLKQFHRTALDIGAVGLGVLHDAMVGRLTA